MPHYASTKKKRRSPSPTTFKKRSKRINRTTEPSWSLVFDRRVVRELIALFTFLIGCLFLLSLIDMAGDVGQTIKQTVYACCGIGAYLLVLLLFVFSGTLLFVPSEKDKASEQHFSTPNVFVGSLVLFFAFIGFSHTLLPSYGEYRESLSLAQKGMGGGVLGFFVSYPLKSAFGPIASFIILVGLFFLGIQVAIGFSWLRTLRFLYSNVYLPCYTILEKAFSFVLPQQQNTSFYKKVKNQEVPLVIEEGGDFTITSKSESKHSDETSLNGSIQGATLTVRGFRDSVKDSRQKSTWEQPASSYGNWLLPSLDLLKKQQAKVSYGDPHGKAKVIEETFVHFGVEAKVIEANCGPSVTQFAVRPAQGVRVAKILSLQNDLALALSAKSVRIEAPIPGRPYVGIEIPNDSIALVTLREILESEEFIKAAQKNDLCIALGRDVSGLPVTGSLAKMPHLLVAGATGSGKSVCSNTMLCSLLYQYSPDDLKFILIDPKVVELAVYNGIPHLLAPVITDPVKTMSALKWAVVEMERRYQLFAEDGHRHLQSYNKAHPNDKLPFIVILIEEFADLMMVAPVDVEASIQRLAQKARATGIHIILSTQRPSANVITGIIKANIPSRIAFSVASQIDSRVILDMQGAEKLLGQGDMLFLSADAAKPTRVQGVYVSDDEINALVEFVKNQGTPEFSEEVLNQVTELAEDKRKSGFNDDDDDDDMLQDALEILAETGKASTSYLQRRLKVGYARAARMMDLLEEKGVVGPGIPGSSKPREVNISRAHELME